MMRDILFRGKRFDNGEWVEGNLFVPDFEKYPTQICIGTHIVRITFEVDPETIGQYTGLTDKNGKKIFEGDIVKAASDVLGSPFEGERIGKIVYDECSYFIEPQNPMESLYLFDECTDYTVIGNIHDNPEMIGGGEDA
jgi:uncharacterized phage protein (TIGR01671 family)